MGGPDRKMLKIQKFKITQQLFRNFCQPRPARDPEDFLFMALSSWILGPKNFINFRGLKNFFNPEATNESGIILLGGSLFQTGVLKMPKMQNYITAFRNFCQPGKY